MRAVLMNGSGAVEVLAIGEAPKPIPSRNEILAKVCASALNRADISQRLGRYPAPAGYPQNIPGLEYSGVVEAIDPAVTLFKAGDRVMGITGGGAHAEYIAVHEREAIPVPDVLTFEEAAAVPEVFLTAYDAMFDRMDLRAGETLLIHAVGSGVGTAAVQLAAVAGIRTIGTSRSANKLEKAHALGLNHGVDARGEWTEKVRSLTSGKGVDAVLDLVGASYLSGNLEVLASKGRMISVGLTAGARAELDMSMLMRKRLTIFGTVLRARPIEEKAALARKFSTLIVPLFQTERLRPVIDSVYDFGDIRQAHLLMESNRSFGKIVLRWS